MTATPLPSNDASQSRRFLILTIAFTVVSLAVIAGIVLIALSVVNSDSVAATVEVARDLFIILLALEMLLAGAAFTVLLIQVARFANLLRNEVLPILASSTEAINTIRGTAAFVSQNLAEPVMQVNAAMAGARQAFKLMRDLSFLRDLVAAATVDGGRGEATSVEQPVPEDD